jgi:hypothetical protein
MATWEGTTKIDFGLREMMEDKPAGWIMMERIDPNRRERFSQAVAVLSTS